MLKEIYKRFEFSYVNDLQTPGKIKVYIFRQPGYKNRSRDMGLIHRWNGKNGSPPYICFKEKSKPDNLDRAKKMAHQWADKTEVYIETGIPISEQDS
jgi:hypothetical protein